MDIGGGHHRLIAFWSWAILDALEDSSFAFVEDPPIPFSGLPAVAFSGFPGDSSTHSKASVAWNSEDVFLHPLFQVLQGLSSFFSHFNQVGPYFTLG
jgi:hypothetical protein